MSQSNILNLPFRRSHSISIAAAIKTYISNKYEQHPDQFAPDLEKIDSLRTQAVSVLEPHPTGIRRIQSYSAQLIWMSGKFPNDLGIAFTWYPALGYHTETSSSQNSIRFELANVLFNLGVLYCQLAVTANRNTVEGLKNAANYFCLSAGAMSYLRTDVVPELQANAPEDMDVMTLECIEKLMLAQAQECFWQKAVKDSMKDAIIAKLAAVVSDYYKEAGDFGIKSDSISSEWIHHMTAKHHHFAGAAQFRAACDCLEKRKYGEEVARLKDSLVCVNEALKESRYVNKIVLSDLNGLKMKVQDDLNRAEKDNDIIYLLPVPPKSELKTLDRVNMVKPKITLELSDPLSLLSEKGELGKPLFSKLVPYSVHLAASVYVDRRDKVINSIADELESLNNRIYELLSSLNLPGSLQALERPLGLPPGMVSHAEEIRQHNGLARLNRSMEDVDRLRTNNHKTYEEAVNLLKAEAAEDEQARRKFGTDRWSRLSSQDAGIHLWTKMKEVEGYLTAAIAGDQKIKNTVKSHETLIRLLNGTDRDLEDYVPSSRRATLTPAVEREVSNLRAALDKIAKMESQRGKKIDVLKAKAKADDVNPDLLREAARLEREYPMQRIEVPQFNAMFDERLRRYEPDRQMPLQEEREQQTLLSKVASANTAFVTARRGDNSTRDREQALQRLQNAYFAYKECIQHLDVGRKFYNDLAQIVNAFREDCRNFAYQRRTEAAHMANEISTTLPMASLSISQPMTHETTGPRRSTRHAVRAGEEAALAAPKPVKPQIPAAVADPESAASPTSAMPVAGMWTPDMPIKFGEQGPPAGQGRRRDGRWDPTKGVNFG